MRKILVLLCSLFCGVSSFAQHRTLFDENWRFCLTDDSLPKSKNYDDSKWRTLNLPHDWSIEGKFDKSNPVGGDGGYLPTGKAWYRKSFFVASKAKDKQMMLLFEGVYMNSKVYVNGELAGGHPYGYSSYYVDITKYLSYGKTNTIAVSVDNSQQKNCRWYSGSGIYRHVWLEERVNGNINDPWKLFVRTEKIYGISADAVTADSALLRISYDGRNDEYRMYRNVRLWSPEYPALYEVKVGDLVVEHGFRTIEFSAEHGFLLNGKQVKLNGGCIHHDNGILGAAAFDKAEWRKAELMKSAGFNAVRTSHNAPAPEFLRACDHLGLLVIDEPFDGWRDEKNKFDYHLLIDEWWQKDLDALVLRDRNHPSVICWSNGNEVIERKKIEVVTTSKKMADRMRELDPTRPVTQALAAWDSDWEIYDPLAATLDITGYNYMIHKAESDHKRVPGRVMWQTESFPRHAFGNWQMVANHDYVIGDFVWTAIDYVGESSIGAWHYDGENQGENWQGDHFPWHGAYCGDIDITGWRKPISHYRELLWSDKPSLYMAVREPQGYIGNFKETSWSVWPTWESWNWAGHEGKPIEVEIYSKYPKVRLYLNDKVIGEKPTTLAEEFKALFSVNYVPGTLRAVALDASGEEIVSSAQLLKTSGTPSKLRLTSTSSTLKADGQDITWVVAEILDSNGNPVADSNEELSFFVSGPVQLVATGSADMKDMESYVSSVRKAWKGRAICALRSLSKPGTARLVVTSKSTKATIRISVAK